MEIVYVAHTQSGVFMLDEQGVCRWAVARPGRTQEQEKVPERIVGAQYVATLDLEEPGGLVALPRVGSPMLFAATDPVSGRIRLVRTPPLLRFEDRRNGPVRKPLVSKLDEDSTPIVPMPIPKSTPPPESFPVPLLRRAPLQPPPRARIVARIPPAPGIPSSGVQSIPVRVRSANMTLKRLARGK
jgi:hypothetical protein